MTAFIRVENLSKQYKRQVRSEGLGGAIKDLFNRKYDTKTAVDQISFSIEKGEVVGYIGPNGAGKSTTIKMLSGILVPTSGIVEVGGMVPYQNRRQYTKNIGVVFGQRTQLWWDIPVSESFKMMKYMYRIPDRQFEQNMQMFTDILDIQSFMHTAVRQLSLGQRMRADLCAALLHNPDILYLDEPTIGLDVVVKEKIRDFIKEINKERKTTVILTTHDMSDIEKLCSRVIVIDQGTIMYDGSLNKLKQVYGTGEIMTVETEDAVDFMPELMRLGIEKHELEGQTLNLYYDKTVINSTAILQFLMGRISITDFVVQPVEIEQIIRKMYLDPAAASVRQIG